MRFRHFNNTSIVGALIAGVQQAPLTDPDAEKCDRCGEPMLTDALGEMWMCANPRCAIHPATGTPESGPT